jgi:hypothetical protein
MACVYIIRGLIDVLGCGGKSLSVSADGLYSTYYYFHAALFHTGCFGAINRYYRSSTTELEKSPPCDIRLALAEP